MADREIRVRLAAEIQSYQQGLRTAAGATAEFGKEITGLQSSAAVNLEKVGRGALIMSGVMATGLGLALKSAVDWESAWAGVLKTVDGTDAQLSSLESGLRSLAQELPASHTEIAGVAEAAGQLGISVGGVEKFTKTMIDLGETTNLSAEQAATSLARFSNIMGTAEGDIDRIGSTIVELGNNSATTEAEIVELGTRLAAAGAIAGLSEADVLAFASTLTSVGVEAEAGGTALSKVFTSVRDAVLDGGDSLETFAEVAGVTTDEFSRMFRDDAAEAVALFIEGLGRMNAAGESTSQVFSDLSLTDQRLMRALLSTAEAGGLLAEQLDMAGRAWEENTALQTEAEKRYETTSAQLEILRNKAVDLGIDLGATLLPAFNGLIEIVGNFADGLAALPGPLKTAAVGIGSLATAGIGSIGILATLAPKVQALRSALMSDGMGAAGQFLGRNLGKIAGGAAALTAAIGAGVVIYEAATRASREYEDAVRGMGAALDGVTSGQKALNDAIAEIETSTYDDLGDKAQAAMRGLRLEMDDFTAATRAGGDALDPLRNQLRAAAEQIEYMGGTLADVDLGQWDNISGDLQFTQALDQLAAQSGITRDELTSLINQIEDYDNAQQDAAKNALVAAANAGELSDEHAALVAAMAMSSGEGANWVALLEEAAPAAKGAAETTERHASALEAEAEAASEAAEAIAALAEQLQAQFDPLFAAQKAMDELTTAQLNAAEAAKEHGADSIEAAAANREVVEAALSSRTAMINLKAAVEGAGGSIDETIATLFSWAEQEIITREQAEQLAAEFRELEGQAASLDGYDVRMGVGLDGAQAVENTLAWLARDRTARIRGNVYYVPMNEGGGRIPVATGGYIDGGPRPIYRSMGGPSGTDTVPAWLTPGEYVLRKSAVDSLGVDFLHGLNRDGADGLRSRYMTEASPAAHAGPATLNLHLEVSSKDGTLRTIRKTVRTEFGGDVQLALGGR